MKNWKTTLSGFITALGVACLQSTDSIVHVFGQILSVVGPLLFGLSAKDHNVTGGNTPQ